MTAGLLTTARALRLALALKEPTSDTKIERVTKLASGVASRVGLAEVDSEVVVLAASVQDVGRLAVPDELLAKQAPLDPQEWQLLKGHTVAAAALLNSMPELRSLAAIVRATHERWDGEGYPDGAAGEDIPVISRILSACDAFVAMTSDRPFRRAVDQGTALQQLAEVAGRQVDPRVAEALVAEVAGRGGGTRRNGAATSAPAPIAATAVQAEGLVAQLRSVAPPQSALSARALRLSYALGLKPGELRTITFELPHADGSRRRAEPCPLSKRELDAVRSLADGKVYGEIAADLGVKVSTIRSHLHSVYKKLGVVDRTQAVLRATERGWL